MISERKIIKLIDLARKCNLCAMSHFKNLDRTQVDYKEDQSPLMLIQMTTFIMYMQKEFNMKKKLTLRKFIKINLIQQKYKYYV